MRMRDNTRTLYRVTSADAARKIAKSGMMLRGSPACMFGSGIYFAETPDIAAGKAFLPALGAGASTSAMGHINAIMASAPTRETARVIARPACARELQVERASCGCSCYAPNVRRA